MYKDYKESTPRTLAIMGKIGTDTINLIEKHSPEKDVIRYQLGRTIEISELELNIVVDTAALEDFITEVVSGIFIASHRYSGPSKYSRLYARAVLIFKKNINY